MSPDTPYQQKVVCEQITERIKDCMIGHGSRLDSHESRLRTIEESQIRMIQINEDTTRQLNALVLEMREEREQNRENNHDLRMRLLDGIMKVAVIVAAAVFGFNQVGIT